MWLGPKVGNCNECDVCGPSEARAAVTRVAIANSARVTHDTFYIKCVETCALCGVLRAKAVNLMARWKVRLGHAKCAVACFPPLGASKTKPQGRKAKWLRTAHARTYLFNAGMKLAAFASQNCHGKHHFPRTWYKKKICLIQINAFCWLGILLGQWLFVQIKYITVKSTKWSMLTSRSESNIPFVWKNSHQFG